MVLEPFLVVLNGEVSQPLSLGVQDSWLDVTGVSNSTGAVHCSFGFELQNDVCTPCPAGTTGNPLSLSAECVPCHTGFTCAGGSHATVDAGFVQAPVATSDAGGHALPGHSAERGGVGQP